MSDKNSKTSQRLSFTPLHAAVRPRLVVSRCLNLEACRYNGERIADSFLERLEPHVEFVPVCPEVAIGMGVPRQPVRLVLRDGPGSPLRLIQPDSDNRDWTEPMNRFSREFLGGLREVDGFILKAASPSCGVQDAKRFPPNLQGASLGKGPGLFAEAVLGGFPHLAVEDEGRLRNLRLREHFLSRIFTWAAFRRLTPESGMSRLVEFHSRHKLLLMAYHQTQMRRLGRIVANPNPSGFGRLLQNYGQHLCAALSDPPRHPSHINVLMHAFGYFSDRLTAGEKSHFLDLLEEYRKKRLALSGVLPLVRSWILRFEEPYLASQVYFDPFPVELVSLHDSGKGRDLETRQRAVTSEPTASRKQRSRHRSSGPFGPS